MAPLPRRRSGIAWVDAIPLLDLLKGDAEMAFLPRFAKVALASSFLFAFTSLPAILPDRVPGSGIAPTAAWAGGSPDETLKPPVPPRARSISDVRGTDVDGATSWKALRTAVARLKGADRWEFIYRIFLTSTHRF